MHDTREKKPRPSAKPIDRPAPSPFATAIVAAVIVMVVFLAYLPALSAGFIWDDDDYVLLNSTLTSDGGWAEMWSLSSPLNAQYYPLVFTTFRIERSLWGVDPTGYHVVNVALHAACAVLLLFLLRRIRVPGAWLVAAIFALHPVCVESVAWVTERKNVLSTFFYLLAALAWLRFDEEDRPAWLVPSFLCFLLALASKTVSASLPIALFLIGWWRRRPLDVRRVVALGAMLAIGLVAGLITKAHEYRHVIGKGSPLDDLTFLDRVLVAGRAFWFYPWKLAWPSSLAFIYPRWEISTAVAWQWLFPIAVVVFGVTLVVLHTRGRIGRGPLAAVAFYAAAIFPALGFVNVAPLRFSWVADHFQYQACIGWIVLAVGGGAWLLSRRSGKLPVAAAGIGGVLSIALGAATWSQAAVFEDLGTLWRDTVAKNPGSWMVQNNYGSWLEEHKDYEAAARCFQEVLRVSPPRSEGALQGYANLASVRLSQGRFEDAVSLARQALSIHSTYPVAKRTLGLALAKLDRFDEAEATFRSLLADAPDPTLGRAAWDIRRRVSDAYLWVELGNIQSARGASDAAIESYRRAIEIEPEKPEAHFNLGNVLLGLGRLDEAAAALERAVKANPKYARAHLLLGEVLARKGRVDDAIRSIDRGIECEPSWPTARFRKIDTLVTAKRFSDAISAGRVTVAALPRDFSVKLELAWLLSTSPDAKDRSGAEALALVRRETPPAEELKARWLEVLAAAQAESGHLDEARGTVRRAIDTVRPLRNATWLLRLDAEAKAYDAGRPWRLEP